MTLKITRHAYLRAMERHDLIPSGLDEIISELFSGINGSYRRKGFVRAKREQELLFVKIGGKTEKPYSIVFVVRGDVIVTTLPSAEEVLLMKQKFSVFHSRNRKFLARNSIKFPFSEFCNLFVLKEDELKPFYVKRSLFEIPVLIDAKKALLKVSVKFNKKLRMREVVLLELKNTRLETQTLLNLGG